MSLALARGGSMNFRNILIKSTEALRHNSPEWTSYRAYHVNNVKKSLTYFILKYLTLYLSTKTEIIIEYCDINYNKVCADRKTILQTENVSDIMNHPVYPFNTLPHNPDF